MEYHLKENESLNVLEYRVLKREGAGIFIPVLCIGYNREKVLIYSEAHMDTLKQAAAEVSDEILTALLLSLFTRLRKIRETGFLSFGQIAADPDRIFADLVKREVFLSYYPLEPPVLSDERKFTEALRTALLGMLAGRTQEFSGQMKAIVQTLKMPDADLSMLIRVCRQREKQQILTLFPEGRPDAEKIRISYVPFVLGKKKTKTDYAFEDQPMVSRVHCRIGKKGESWQITDLGSANGTFVNFQQIPPDTDHEIRHGDILRLANLDFRVEITEEYR